MAERSISFIDPKTKTDKTSVKHTLHQMFNATIWCTFDVFYIQYMLPILLASIHASGFVIGITLSSQTLGLALSGPIIGKIINNRSNIARVILFGCLFKSISLTILYLGFCFELTPLLIIGMFCVGLSITAIRDSLRVIVSDHTCFENRSEYLGKLRQRGGIGALIGWSIGFLWFGLASTNNFIKWNSHIIDIHTHWWFRTVPSFSIFVIGCLFSGWRVSKYIKIIQSNSISAPKTVPDTANKNKSSTSVNIAMETNNNQVQLNIKDANNSIQATQSSSSLKLRNNQGFIGLLLLLGIERFVGTLMRPFAIVFLVEKFTNYSETVLLLCYTPGGLLAIMMAPLIGRILDKIKLLPRYTLCIVSFVGAAITLAFIYCNMIIQLLFIVIGDCTVITIITLALNKMISTLSKQYRGTVFGMSTAVEQTCTMIGPLVGGILWDYIAHTAPFWASVVAEVFIAVIYVAFFFVYPLDASASDNT